MKKAKIFMTAGLMAFSLLSGMSFTKEKVSAAETVKCELTNAEGHRGDTVSVTINVTQNPGTIMSETKFAYDSDVVEVIKVTEHDMFRTEAIGNTPSDYMEPNMEKNPIQLTNGYLACASNSTNTGNLYTMELKIKDDAVFGKSEISFYGVFYDWEFNDFPVICDKADITIVCGHEDIREEVEKAPTCTETGINKKVCNICEEIIGTVNVSAEGHSFGEWEQVNAATCTEAGTDRRVCGICGIEETRDVAALGHKISTWTVTKVPTYTEEGLKEGECTRCHEKITQVILKLSETEIVEADDMFSDYKIDISTKVFDTNNNELSDNKLQLKAQKIEDTASAKEGISKLIAGNEEVKALSVFEIKLVTNTDKIEVGSLDKPLNVTLKVPADYATNGKVYVLGADGVWTKADVRAEEGTISFDMTETQTYAFANLGAVENKDNNTNHLGNSNNSDSNNKSEENKDNTGNNLHENTSKEPVKTGDSSAMSGFIGIMILSGLAVVISKKKVHE